MAGFRYRLHRLNVVHDDQMDVFDGVLSRIDSDEATWRVIQAADNSKLDKQYRAKSRTYKWSIRYARRFENVVIDEADLGTTDVICLTLARSVLEEAVDSVTDTGIARMISRSTPPPAKSVRMLFFMSRHLVLVEYDSSIFRSQRWQDAFAAISSSAAQKLGYSSSLHLSSITSTHKINEMISSFRSVTRLKVHLRIPNPDLTSETRALYHRMRDDQIRELKQDFFNPDGISMQSGSLPRQSIETAGMGYKEGEVTIEGRDEEGNPREITSGEEIVEGHVPRELPDYTEEHKKEGLFSVLLALARQVGRSFPKQLESWEKYHDTKKE